MVRDPEVVIIMMSNRNGAKDVTQGKASCKGYRGKRMGVVKGFSAKVTMGTNCLLKSPHKNDKRMINFSLNFEKSRAFSYTKAGLE